MLNPRRGRTELAALAYIGILLLGCSSGGKKWQATPAAPAATVEQKSSLEVLHERAEAQRGSTDPAVAYAERVADELEGGAEVDAVHVTQAQALLDAAAQADPLRAADIEYARGRVQYANRDYETAVATYETNARVRGDADSATAVVQYCVAAGQRERLTSFCNDVFPLIRGGESKNVFITECVSGMGYASPAEWDKISGPALVEYERWRAEHATAEQEAKNAKAAAVKAEQDRAQADAAAQENRRNCILRCQEKEAICKSNCANDQCRDDCSDAEWACRRQC